MPQPVEPVPESVEPVPESGAHPPVPPPADPLAARRRVDEAPDDALVDQLDPDGAPVEALFPDAAPVEGGFFGGPPVEVAGHRIGRHLPGGSARTRRVAAYLVGLAVLVAAGAGLADHLQSATVTPTANRSDDRASRDEIRIDPTLAVPVTTPPTTAPATPSPTPTPLATTTTVAPKPVTTTRSTAPRATAKAPLVASAGCSAYTGNRLIACNLLPSFGFSTGEMAALSPMWDKESGWTTTAANPSGAYGIPQALPGSKMATAGADWRTNPATQIGWGLSYIKGRYGTPSAAWSFWQSHSWY